MENMAIKRKCIKIIGIFSVFGGFMLFASAGLQSVVQKFEYEIDMHIHKLANCIELNSDVALINPLNCNYSISNGQEFDIRIYLKSIDVNAFCTIKSDGEHCVLILNGVKSTSNGYANFLSGKDLPPLKAIKINAILKDDFLKQFPYKPKTITNAFNFIFSYFAYYIMEYVAAAIFITQLLMCKKKHLLLYVSHMIFLLAMLFPFYSGNIYSFKQSVASTSWIIFGLYYLLMGTTSGVLWLLYILSAIMFYFYNRHNSNQMLLNGCIVFNLTVILYGILFIIFPGYLVNFPYSSKCIVITNIEIGYILWLMSLGLKEWFLLKQKRVYNGL